MSMKLGLLPKRGALLSVALVCLIGLQACATKKQHRELEERVGANEASIAELKSKVDNLKVEPKILGRLTEGVNFDTGSAVLTADARGKIDDFLSGLGPLDDAWVLVVGATDVRGSASANFALGQSRANAVTKYLVTEKGVEPALVITRTVGKSRPIGEQTTPESLFVNRRVELVVFRFVAVSS